MGVGEGQNSQPGQGETSKQAEVDPFGEHAAGVGVFLFIFPFITMKIVDLGNRLVESGASGRLRARLPG